jgi:hypothetical protein
VTHSHYNRINFPHFVVNNGNWDIYANDKGYCASIPTPEAETQGCNATHFGDAEYVRITLRVSVKLDA